MGVGGLLLSNGQVTLTARDCPRLAAEQPPGAFYVAHLKTNSEWLPTKWVTPPASEAESVSTRNSNAEASLRVFAGMGQLDVCLEPHTQREGLSAEGGAAGPTWAHLHAIFCAFTPSRETSLADPAGLLRTLPFWFLLSHPCLCFILLDGGGDECAQSLPHLSQCSVRAHRLGLPATKPVCAALV